MSRVSMAVNRKLREIRKWMARARLHTGSGDVSAGDRHHVLRSAAVSPKFPTYIRKRLPHVHAAPTLGFVVFIACAPAIAGGTAERQNLAVSGAQPDIAVSEPPVRKRGTFYLDAAPLKGVAPTLKQAAPQFKPGTAAAPAVNRGDDDNLATSSLKPFASADTQTHTQARAPASPQDMQALIEATRSLARATRTTADSIGMPHDRLNGILLRLDKIEAKMDHLKAQPVPDPAHSVWR